ncbi:MIB-like protein [Mya arenaria]|uniref:MIB-like protein n=1 Tax=Mya arenaria TaxID=6604 RepID=A0ABY7DNT3_MYAAR|nr:MIB-like protein [Mya arenaria]
MDPTERGRKLLDAINKGDEKKVVELVINGKSFHKVDFNVIDRGDNAVHLAARKGMLDVLKLLAKIGADLAQRNIDGDSPLHRAIGSQPMDIIETLVDVGMDPNLQNSVTGDTPLHVAMKLGSQEAMEALLIKGARSAVLNNSVYCPLEIALTPETMYYCIVFVRPRIEEHEISENETKITSDMEKDFVMDIQGETFDTDTALKLQVFESQDPNNSDKYEMDMSEDEEVSPEAEMKQRQDDQILVSDVFQINVSGNQPKKPVTVQIPMCKGMKAGDDIVIVSGNEQDLARENALEVLPFKPKVVNTSLIFEVSHFSMFTATWRKWDVDKVKEELLNVKEKRKPVSFYAVVQKDEEDATGLGHKLIVDCCLANRSQKTRNKWLDQGYEEQNPPETGEMMTVLGDTFTIDVVGNASFEEPSADSDRKIQFWICRSCEQGYNVRLHVGIFEQEEAYGHVVIYKISGDSKTEVARLRILLEPPQKPNDKQTEPQPGKQAKKAIRKPKPPKKSKEKKEKETPRRASNASTSSSLWEWFNKREHRPPSAVMEPVKK